MTELASLRGQLLAVLESQMAASATDTGKTAVANVAMQTDDEQDLCHHCAHSTGLLRFRLCTDATCVIPVGSNLLQLTHSQDQT